MKLRILLKIHALEKAKLPLIEAYNESLYGEGAGACSVTGELSRKIEKVDFAIQTLSELLEEYK